MTRAAAAVAVIAAGAAAEFAAAPQTGSLLVADFAVGAGLGCAGAYLLERKPWPAAIALGAAAAWFAGTLAGAEGTLGATGGILILAYRGPVIHLLLGATTGRLHNVRLRVVAAAGWIAGVLPLEGARTTTAVIALLVAAQAARAARRAAAGQRRLLTASAIAAALLGILWGVTALGYRGGDRWLVLNDALVAAAAAIALAGAAGMWTRGATRAMVIELGPARRPGQPLTTRLSRALADPNVELRYKLADGRWVDEHGRSAPDPRDDSRTVTRASAPEGDEVALLHSEATDRRLAQAAAAASALVGESARLEADVRRRADDVRASRRRLLNVADAERRTLEQHLTDSVLTRLRHAARLLTEVGDASRAERTGLETAIAELIALGGGLYPPTLARADVLKALREITARSTVPATLSVQGSLADLPEAQRTAIWFICSEALTNVARHARASKVDLIIRAHDHLDLEIRDDGKGGATLARGLRGLADRADALGGNLSLSSPHGGPTSIHVRLPLDDR